MATSPQRALEVVVKRAYNAPDANDGYRVLVDRLWPRGIRKDDLKLDEWCRDVAPSGELRTWFGHKSERFAEFSDRYEQELDGSDAPHALLERVPADRARLTLVYAAHDQHVNHAVVLQRFLTDMLADEHTAPTR